MFRKILWWAAQVVSVASVFVFITSLCALDSPSPIPFITLLASEAWIVFYIMRERKGDKNAG